MTIARTRPASDSGRLISKPGSTAAAGRRPKSVGVHPLQKALRWRLHHPDISLPVLRRRLAADVLDLICIVSEFALTRGRSLLRPTFIASGTAADMAVRRLAKAGLVVYQRARGASPTLALTTAGQSCGTELVWPERFWNRRWDGRWYILMYDIPEAETGYRRSLEYFLKRERMGGLQRSVWVSARDIRPLFDDLDQAAEIRRYAVLFEATTVLGQPPRQIAAQAWNLMRLAERQRAYISACKRRTHDIRTSLGIEATLAAVREEMNDYIHLMAEDPLLPSVLLPDDYLGPTVVKAFRARLRTLAGSLFHLG